MYITSRDIEGKCKKFYDVDHLVPRDYFYIPHNLVIEAGRHTKDRSHKDNVYAYTVEMGVLMIRYISLQNVTFTLETRQRSHRNIKYYIDGCRDCLQMRSLSQR